MFGGLKITGKLFDRRAITSAVERAQAKFFTRAVQRVRTAAVRSIRAAAQKNLAELSADELLEYRIRSREAKKLGRPRPKRPLRHSKPGEPPRSVIKVLRGSIRYAIEDEAAVIGAEHIPGRSGAAAVLEHGGTINDDGETFRIEPRPFMQPALEAITPGLPALWRDLVR